MAWTVIGTRRETSHRFVPILHSYELDHFSKFDFECRQIEFEQMPTSQMENSERITALQLIGTIFVSLKLSRQT